MKLIEDYNVERITIEWGGVEVMPRSELLLLTGWSEAHMNTLIDDIEKAMGGLLEDSDYILLDNADFCAVMHPSRAHVFEDIDLDGMECCYSRSVVINMLGFDAKRKLDNWFSPFSEYLPETIKH